jgi:hypothetical protein
VVDVLSVTFVNPTVTLHMTAGVIPSSPPLLLLLSAVVLVIFFFVISSHLR